MCTSPLVLVKYGKNPETGKPYTSIKRRLDYSLADYYRDYGRDNVFLVPCGHCSECILKRRKEWAFRCSLEALYYPANSFITLTYDDQHLPATLNEVKIHLKKFIKDIRNRGYKVRYFGCGELGEKTGRKHAHIILFGFLPKDIEYDSTSDSNQAIYTSKLVDDIWAKGLCTVQMVGSNVGQYVAGYTSKKLGLKTGFQIQSSRPGIGFQFLIDNKNLILAYDRIYSKAGSGKIPRYFEKLLDGEIDEVKLKRIDMAAKLYYKYARDHNLEHIEQLNFMNREHFDRVLAQLGRSL